MAKRRKKRSPAYTCGGSPLFDRQVTCPRCHHTGSLDQDYDVGLADDGCVFCNLCNTEFNLETGDDGGGIPGLR